MQRCNMCVRHAPPWNIIVSSYVRADRIAPQFFPFLSRSKQASCLSIQIESGVVLRQRESYSLHSSIIPQVAEELLPPLEHISSVLSRSARRLEVIGWSCRRGCQNKHAWSCHYKCQKNIANKSAVRSAIGHFGQEVSEIKLSPDMSDKRLAHGNRFTDCMVANRIAFLLQGRLRSG